MKTCSFVALLIPFLGLLSAYGLTGAYERLFYYSAYLIDSDLQNGGQPSKIAPGCSKKGPCSFRDFVAFIENSALDNQLDISKERISDIDGTAKLLLETGHAGKYSPSKVVSGVSDGRGIAPAIDKVSEFVKGHIDNKQVQSSAYLTMMRRSALRIQFFRMEGRNEELKQTLKNSQLTIVTRDKLFLNDMYQFVERNPTIQANKIDRDKVHQVFQAFDNPSTGIAVTHKTNVESVTNALRKLSSCSNNS